MLTLAEKTNTDIEAVISRQRGNLLLIDFWASWCVPCRAEFPFSRKLEREYAKEKFKTVYISLDKDILSWKKASLTKNIENKTSFRLLNSGASQFVSKYDHDSQDFQIRRMNF